MNGGVEEGDGVNAVGRHRALVDDPLCSRDTWGEGIGLN